MLIGKKMLCFAFGVGVGITAAYLYSANQNSVDQKVKCLKRKVKRLEKQLMNTLKGLKPEQMQKYKSEIETKLKEIKEKIDNLTIRDIKDATSNAYNSIKQNISNLSSKMISFVNNEENMN